MKSLVKLIFALIDLLKTEARAVREAVVRIAIALGLLVGAGVLALTGLGFLIAALYLLLAWALGSAAGGAAVTGGIILIAAGIIVWIAKKLA